MENFVDELEPLEKYLVLLIDSSTSGQVKSIKGNLRLQKEMFLLSKAIKELEEEFKNYKLGPFSEMLDEAVEQLATSKFFDKSNNEIRFTDKGQKLADSLRRTTDKHKIAIVSDVKEFADELSYDEILCLVYGNFEETTEKSEIKDEIERKRLPVAIDLFKKGIIGTAVAAKIGNISIKDFLNEIKRRGIKTPVKPTTKYQRLGPIITSILSKREKIVSRDDLMEETLRLAKEKEICFVSTNVRSFDWSDINERGVDECLKSLVKLPVTFMHVGTCDKKTSQNEYFTLHVRD